MIVKRILLTASALALMSSPAWAGPPSTTPNSTDNPGAAHRSPTAEKAIENAGAQNSDEQGSNTQGTVNHPSQPSHPGNSHKCQPHRVGYVAAGTLSSQKLVQNSDGTYSGEVTIEVKRANHHAAGDKNMTKSYPVEKVRVIFALADTNSDGTVGLDDLKTGDQVMLIGKITALAKKCSAGEFKPKTTIRQIIFHAPQPS